MLPLEINHVLSQNLIGQNYLLGGLAILRLIRGSSEYQKEEKTNECQSQTRSNLIYRIKYPTKQAKAPVDIDNDLQIIYIIEEDGNKGIWIRDIRVKSNLVAEQDPEGA